MGSGRLDELIRAAAPATLYVCGGSDNQHELADRFSQVFLLEIDEPTMLARLDARRVYHDWAHIGNPRVPVPQAALSCRTACAHPARSPSTPDSPSTRWWTRCSPACCQYRSRARPTAPAPVPGAGAGNPRLAAVFTSAGAFGHSGPRPMIGLRFPWRGGPPTGRFAPRRCACRL